MISRTTTIYDHKATTTKDSSRISAHKVKANKTMKGQVVPNHRRRKGKGVENNIDLAAHNQTLKQLRILNDRNHNISISTNTEC
jgi:hypothetical protein